MGFSSGEVKYFSFTTVSPLSSSSDQEPHDFSLLVTKTISSFKLLHLRQDVGVNASQKVAGKRIVLIERFKIQEPDFRLNVGLKIEPAATGHFPET